MTNRCDAVHLAKSWAVSAVRAEPWTSRVHDDDASKCRVVVGQGQTPVRVRWGEKHAHLIISVLFVYSRKATV